LLGADSELEEQKHLCSNPNCRNVFSKPRIIEYHVCPVCQTLVNTIIVSSQEEIENALPPENILKITVPVETNTDIQEDLKPPTVETERIQPELEELCTSEQKPEVIERGGEPEALEIPIQEAIVSATVQQETKAQTNAVSVPSSDCQYGFGYLRQREKGEGIPDTCIECSKSLDCMLSEYYKAEKSVKEIKKWYDL